MMMMTTTTTTTLNLTSLGYYHTPRLDVNEPSICGAYYGLTGVVVVVLSLLENTRTKLNRRINQLEKKGIKRKQKKGFSLTWKLTSSSNMTLLLLNQ